MGAGRWSLIASAIVAAAAAVPSLAQGQDKVCATHPRDPSVVCVRDNWHTVDVCDRDADGHRAYARVVTRQSYPAYMSPFYDENDSKTGCTNLHFDPQVVSVAVCVQTEGCSAQKATGVPPPDKTPPQPTPTPAPAPPPTPAPAPPPPPPASSGVQLGVGLGCAPRGKRMPVSLTIHKRAGKAKPRVKRVVFYYRKKNRGKRVVARTDRHAPYKRTLPIQLPAGPHHVYARVYYKRPGSSKLRRRTVKRRFTVCA
jgi:hypothetical protein